MKIIPLKKVTLSNSQVEGFEFNYRKELLQIIEISAEGMTVSQMGSALKIQKGLQSVSDEGALFLEDADQEWLKGRMVANKWRFVAPEIQDFHDEVCNAKDAEAPHLKGEDKSPKNSKAKTAEA
jgi:hypothetical protein